MTQPVKHLDLVAAAEPLVSADAFRGAMRRLPGGVSVITAGRGRDITGMTVSSVSALSVDPPTLIVSINRQSSSWPIVRREGRFAVNFLAQGQREVAERFTGRDGLRGAERFLGVPWQWLPSGTPVLLGTAASLDCVVDEVIERHSHAIVIGSVRDVRRSEALNALAYWHGDYVRLGEADADAALTPFL